MKSNKERILEFLKDNQLTSSELADKTGIDIDSIYVYLNQLYKNKKVERITNKKPYKYKNSTLKTRLNEYKELLKFMNEFFKENIQYLLENEDIREFILNHKEFDKIEEVIK